MRLACPVQPGDSLGRRELASATTPSARLLFHNSPWAHRSPDPMPSRSHFRSVGWAAFMNPSDQGVEWRWYCDNNRIAAVRRRHPESTYPASLGLRARLARDTASTTCIRRIGSMLGKGASLVRFPDSKKSEWRAMLRWKKHEGAAYSPLYVRLP